MKPRIERTGRPSPRKPRKFKRTRQVLSRLLLLALILGTGSLVFALAWSLVRSLPEPAAGLVALALIFGAILAVMGILKMPRRWQGLALLGSGVLALASPLLMLSLHDWASDSRVRIPGRTGGYWVSVEEYTWTALFVGLAPIVWGVWALSRRDRDEHLQHPDRRR